MSPMNSQTLIEEFLGGQRFAVVGASTDRAKYGNKVLRCYLQNGRDVQAVHPREARIEGVDCVSAFSDLAGSVDGLSIVTPPAVTESIVEAAAAAGIKHLWMQPGAESAVAVKRAEELGLAVIFGGPCVLVELGFSEEGTP
jgi:predicted CoA-binding protein